MSRQPQKENKSKILAEKVYRLVQEIPPGKVATYGQLAVLAGYAANARLVGKALKFCPLPIACHRVVNSAGRLVPGWQQQREKLEQEGVTFMKNGCVDLKLHRWK